MSLPAFDPIAWASDRGLVPGPSILTERPSPLLAGRLEIDPVSRAVVVDPGLSTAVVERALRDDGFTLGRFPERFEHASVGELVANDEPGAGASGAGFAQLLLGYDETALVLAVRQRPAAQAGRGIVVESLDAGAEVLRSLAQGGLLPEIAFVADPPAAQLYAHLVGDLKAWQALANGHALAVLIAAGASGEAGLRLEEAVAGFSDIVVADLGQGFARRWAAARYDLPGHAAHLASRGILLDVRRAWHRWSTLGAALDVPSAAAWCGREVLGADGHGAVLSERTLASRARSGEGQEPDASGDEDGAGEPTAADVLTEEHGG